MLETLRSRLSGNKPAPQSREASWNNTADAIQRMEDDDNPLYEERGLLRKEKKFHGRDVIGRDSAINGGVYLGSGVREAIVVDDIANPELLGVYNDLLKKNAARGEDRGRFLLRDVWELVKAYLPKDPNAIKKMSDFLKNLKPDQEVPITEFIHMGGACRHHAVLAGYLIEKLLNDTEQPLEGKVSVNRNVVEGKGGHAWAEYTWKGEVYILDIANNFFGKLSDIKEDDNRWPYERPKSENTGQGILSRIRSALW